MSIGQIEKQSRFAVQRPGNSVNYRGSHCRLIAISFAILAAAIRIGYAYARAATPFQLEYEEGNILNAGIRILHGATPYPPSGSFPYVLNPYGPIAYLLSAFGVKLGGLSLLGPRLLVLLGGIGITILVGLLAKAQRVRMEISVLFAVFFLCSPIMWEWLPLLRVDLWAVFLTLLGLYVFQTNHRYWLIAAIIFAFALLTKHTALAAPASCLFELLLEKRLLRSLAFCAIVIALFLTGVGVASLNGSPWFHLLNTHPDSYSFIRLFVAYAIAAGWTALVLGVIIYSSAFGFRPTAHTRVAWIYFVLCSLTVFTAGKLGSNTNHFLEWTAAACILGAVALDHLLQVGEPVAISFGAGLAVLCICLAFPPRSGLARSKELSDCSQAYSLIRSSAGQNILSEDVSAVVLGGKPVLVSNPFVTTQLGHTVSWSRGSIDQMVGAGYFDLILLGDDPHVTGRWSPALKQAIADNYKLERQFHCSPFMAYAFVRK